MFIKYVINEYTKKNLHMKIYSKKIIVRFSLFDLKIVHLTKPNSKRKFWKKKWNVFCVDRVILGINWVLRLFVLVIIACRCIFESDMMSASMNKQRLQNLYRKMVKFPKKKRRILNWQPHSLVDKFIIVRIDSPANHL